MYQVQVVIQSHVKHELLENADELILWPSEIVMDIFVRNLDISVILFFKIQVIWTPRMMFDRQNLFTYNICANILRLVRSILGLGSYHLWEWEMY